MRNLLTDKEIASKIGLSRRQIQIKIIKPMFKKIPEKEFAQKIDGKWFFSFEKVLKFIQIGKQGE